MNNQQSNTKRKLEHTHLLDNFKHHIAQKINEIEVLWIEFNNSEEFFSQSLNDLLLVLQSLRGTSASIGANHFSETIRLLSNKLEQLIQTGALPADLERTAISDLIQELHNGSTNHPIGHDLPTIPIVQEIDNSKNLITIILLLNDQNLEEIISSLVNTPEYQLIVVKNESEFAQQILKIKTVDLAIIDLKYSDALKLISVDNKQSLIDSNNAPFPIIFFAESDSLETRLKSSRSGGKKFFKKPINIDSFSNALGRELEKIRQKAYRVLIIDDDEMMLKYYSYLFQNTGIVINTLDDPLYALDAIHSFEPDILLLDIYMPFCSGFELAQVIRQEEDYTHLPFVFLTTDDEADKHLKGIQLGSDDFLTKPVDPDYLVKLLEARAKRSRNIRLMHNELKNKILESDALKITLDQHSIVSMASPDGMITDVNDKFCEISGYQRSELIGKTHNIVNSGLHNTKFFTHLWDKISKGETWRGEICNRRKNGSLYWVDSIIVPFIDSFGIPQQYISIRTDITEIKIAEEKVKLHNKKLAGQQQSLIELTRDDSVVTTGLGSSFQNILKKAVIELKVDRASIWELNDKYDELNCQSIFATDPKLQLNELSIAKPDYPELFDQLTKNLTTSLSQTEKTEFSARLMNSVFNAKAGALLCISLYHNNQLIGALILESHLLGKIWQPDEEHFCKALADLVSIRYSQSENILATNKMCKSEERFRLSQKYANIGTWDWDIQTDELFWSERIAPLFGYREKIPRASYDHFLDIIHKDDKDLVIEAIDQCINQEAEFNIEHRVVWQDGTIHWIHEQGDVVRDHEGKPLHMLGVVQDISDRKLLEQRIYSQKSLLDLIRNAFLRFVSLNDIKEVSGYLIKGLMNLTETDFGFIGELIQQPDGNTKILLHAIETLASNSSPQSSFNSNTEKLIDLDTLPPLIGNTIKQGKPAFDNHFKQKTNNDLFTAVNLHNLLSIPIFHGDHMIGIFGLANIPDAFNEEIINFLNPFTITYGVLIHAERSSQLEIEHKKLLEQSRIDAEKANTAKSVFLSKMSHELRTPLNAILGFSQLLEMNEGSSDLSDDQLEYVDEIKNAGSHLLELINDILDLSKVESGLIEIEPAEFNLMQLLEKCLALVSPLANEKSISLETIGDDVTLYSDERRIKQVLLNLISNAIKYNKENGCVKIHTEVTSNQQIKISISDTGMGISPENVDKVFTSFDRLDAEKTNIEGTGIGLVISKSLVELLQGSIDFETILGQGTTFWFTLPKKYRHNE